MPFCSNLNGVALDLSLVPSTVISHCDPAGFVPSYLMVKYVPPSEDFMVYVPGVRTEAAGAGPEGAAGVVLGDGAGVFFDGVCFGAFVGAGVGRMGVVALGAALGIFTVDGVGPVLIGTAAGGGRKDFFFLARRRHCFSLNSVPSSQVHLVSIHPAGQTHTFGDDSILRVYSHCAAFPGLHKDTVGFFGVDFDFLTGGCCCF